MRLADYISFTLALAVTRISCTSAIKRVMDELSNKLYLKIEQKIEIATIMRTKALHMSAICGHISLNESDIKSRMQDITYSSISKIKDVLLHDQKIIFEDSLLDTY